MARLLAGALLMVGSLDALRNRDSRHLVLPLDGPALAMLLVTAVVEAQAGSLPSLGSIAAPTSPARPRP
jgi:hypothetical protein